MGRLSALALLLSVAVPPAAGAAAALIQNGAFTATAGGMPASWHLEAWDRELTDVGWEPVGDGAGMVRIVNRGPNDARLCQTLAVSPGVSYRVSARVKTENVGQATAGALIAIEPRIADSIDVKGTQDWQRLEVSASNADQSTWDICLRLGSYANLNTGTAWFSDVRVEAIGTTGAEHGSPWPNLGVGALLVTMRQTPWVQTALPLVAGLVLAFGLGIVGRRPR
jgi:hypothetical protein